MRAPRWLTRELREGAGRLADAARRPGATVSDAIAFTSSLRRIVRPPPVEPSPLLRRRSLSRRLETVEFPLDSLRAAAKRADGSVNDAYLAAVGGVLGRYHDALGIPVDEVSAAIPVNLRSDDDPIGGNRWAGARLAIPTGPSDPIARTQYVRELVLTARAEPAIDAMRLVAPVLSRSPAPLLNRVTALAQGHDVQVSNVPGPQHAVFVAGVEITRQYAFGPLPGPAMMITMFSQAGTCTVGINYDPAAVTDDHAFRDALRSGFDDVLGLGVARLS
jgi:diacylglycerol O-acyltransferase / wax synthase